MATDVNADPHLSPLREDGFRDFAESLIENIDEVFFWRDPDNITPYFVSHAYERIWGRSCESAYADPSSWIDSIHPDDRDRVIREFERAGTACQRQVEYRIILPDGAVRWIWTRTFPARTEAGSATRLIGIAQDCTERKQAEETRGFLASIVESSDDSIIGTDLNGTILSWNRGAEKLFGYTAEETIGKHIAFLFLVNRQSDHLTTLDKIQRDERIERFEAVRVDKAGIPIDVSVILSPIKDPDGRLRGVSAIYRNITRRKRADAELFKAKEAAEAASKVKSEFLANMSHEIRTPMNGIMGMTELLLDAEPTADQREYLDIVKYSAESLLSIINDILDLSRIEAQKLSLERQEFNLRETLCATIKEMAVQADKKGLGLSFNILPGTPEAVVGDPGRLRQILVNLLGNAVKFTDAGQVVLTVAPAAKGADILHFAVRDTGPGIPSEKHAVIFEAFTQADGSTTRQFGGTGLGLTIAARLVGMMGGRLWVESDGLIGSTFHFTACLETVRTTR